MPVYCLASQSTFWQRIFLVCMLRMFHVCLVSILYRKVIYNQGESMLLSLCRNGPLVLLQCAQGSTRFRRRWFNAITSGCWIRLCGTFSEVLQESTWRCRQINTYCTRLEPIPIRTTILNPLLAGYQHLISGRSLFPFCHKLLKWDIGGAITHTPNYTLPALH